MELPKNMPSKIELRKILGEFYDMNKNKQWFAHVPFNTEDDAIGAVKVLMNFKNICN